MEGKIQREQEAQTEEVTGWGNEAHLKNKKNGCNIPDTQSVSFQNASSVPTENPTLVESVQRGLPPSRSDAQNQTDGAITFVYIDTLGCKAQSRVLRQCGTAPRVPVQSAKARLPGAYLKTGWD